MRSRRLCCCSHMACFLLVSPLPRSVPELLRSVKPSTTRRLRGVGRERLSLDQCPASELRGADWAILATTLFVQLQPRFDANSQRRRSAGSLFSRSQHAPTGTETTEHVHPGTLRRRGYGDAPSGAVSGIDFILRPIDTFDTAPMREYGSITVMQQQRTQTEI